MPDDTVLGTVDDLDNPNPIDGNVDGHVKPDDPITPPVVDDHNKPDDKPDADAKPDEDGKPSGAPDEYEAFKSLEGKETTEDQLKAFHEFAKELNLTQEQADKYVAKVSDAVEQTADAQIQLWNSQNEEWQAASRSDKEFGGLKFEENLGIAKKAIQQFGTTELLEVIDNYGMGNHPEFIRLLVRVGKAMSEDGMVTGIGGKAAPVDAASILYPNQGK